MNIPITERQQLNLLIRSISLFYASLSSINTDLEAQGIIKRSQLFEEYLKEGL